MSRANLDLVVKRGSDHEDNHYYHEEFDSSRSQNDGLYTDWYWLSSSKIDVKWRRKATERRQLGNFRPLQRL